MHSIKEETGLRILAIESSCDETAASVVEDGRKVISSIIATQISTHKLYGGVVPEIASRMHCESIVPVVEEALAAASMEASELDAIAVTACPGLIGALLVGVNFAKGMAMALDKPLIPVHHIRGHVAANYLVHPELKPPFLCLIVSGGHTHIVEVTGFTSFRVIGRTRDDAAGEAFDKAARAMGYPYPGGVEIDKASVNGDSSHYAMPRPRVEGSRYDMSFSGLKTSVMNLINNSAQKGEVVNKDDLSASFQLAVCDILADRVTYALKETGHKLLVAAGGVCANSGIRARLDTECKKLGIRLYMPPLCYCGDNAAMIGSQAYYEYQAGKRAGLDLNAAATFSIEEELC